MNLRTNVHFFSLFLDKDETFGSNLPYIFYPHNESDTFFKENQLFVKEYESSAVLK